MCVRDNRVSRGPWSGFGVRIRCWGCRVSVRIRVRVRVRVRVRAIGLGLGL